MYLGEYANYYPCYPHYGRSVGYLNKNAAFGDPQTGTAVWTSGTLGRGPYLNTRMIGLGLPGDASESSGRVEGTVPDGGRLAMAPYGLGVLVYSGHLADIRTLFCPSTGGGNAGSEEAGIPRLFANAAYLLRHFERAGGYDKEALFFGDWGNWVTKSSTNPTDNAQSQGMFTDTTYCRNGRAAVCDYVYRGLPMELRDYRNYTIRGDSPDENPSAPAGYWVDRIPIPYTKPQTFAVAGAPQFKTPKLLKSRALISDSYQKKQDTNGQAPRRGDGSECHIDGYTTLYGDWSTRWYGDTEQRIIYWDTSSGNASSSYGCGFHKPIMYEWYGGRGSFYYARNIYTGGAPDATNPNYKEISWYAVWHILDTSAGIDLVPYPGI